MRFLHLNVINKISAFCILLFPLDSSNEKINKFLWECDETSVLESYLASTVILAAEIEDFYFKNEKLHFKINSYQQFKEEKITIDEFVYDHPSAFSDFKSGITWMQSMTGRNYILYLNKINGVYTLDICSRIVESSENNAYREIEMLLRLDENKFDNYWINNHKLSKTYKAIPKTDIDSLISSKKAQLDTLEGYPVVNTQFIVDKFGRLVGSFNTAANRFSISEFNELNLTSNKNSSRNDEVAHFFNSLSSSIDKWTPARCGELTFNSLITIKWELREDKSVIYTVT